MADLKPILLYDGKCGFCRIWIDYWRKLTGERIQYATSQEMGARFPQISAEDYSKAVQLIRPDGTVASGARAIFETLGKESWYRWAGAPSEILYKLIAGHRNVFYHLTHWTFGEQIEPARFDATRWLFIRALALIYIMAFGSLAAQVTGLIGERGILPVGDFLNSVGRTGSAIRYLAVPSIFWLGRDDKTLAGMCFAGIAFALVLILTGFRSGKFERLLLILLFVVYLSFVSVGQEFLSFQWDALLLETGFLAIFLGRNRIIPWLFRWLGFRLFFLSGAVKLASGDPNWRNLSALGFHWHSQPLPTVVSWYVNLLPTGFDHFATAATLGIEVIVPFFVFLPRRIRMLGAWILISLQVLIFLTGNYTFFNFLAVLICVFWFDDRVMERFVPSFVRRKIGQTGSGLSWFGARGDWRPITVAVVVVVMGLSVAETIETFGIRLPTPVNTLLSFTRPLQIVSTYGLFAVMTTQRMEIVVEGSADGETWLPYEFKYKPDQVTKAPPWVAPYQPRLDWQMWFAALSNYRENPWFVNFAVRLLEGSPAVVELLQSNPFAGNPPKFVRANVYEYTFTDLQEKKRTGAWWKKEARGVYLPPVGLRTAAP